VLGIEAANAPYLPAIETIQQALLDINALALEIKKLTGNQRDPYKEWVISDYIPDIEERLSTIAQNLIDDKGTLSSINQSGASPEILTYQMAIDNLLFLAADPDNIPVYMRRFSEGTGSAAQLLGSLLPLLQNQPLALDKIYIYSPDNITETPAAPLATITAPTPAATSDPTQALAQADAAWRRGAIEDALEIYGGALAAAPNDVTAHFRYTLAHVMEGRADDALIAAERTVTANPFSSDAWAVRALALNRSGQPAAAIASARQALALNPNNARAYAYMAEAYLEANQIALARTTNQRALSLNPDSVEALYVAAVITRDADFLTSQARDQFQLAYELAPNLPYIAVNLAWAEWAVQNYGDAEDILQSILELNPGNLDALFAAGYLYYQAFGDPNRSLNYLERCIAADPENVACLRYMGTVQTGSGDAQAALLTYQRLIAAGTDRASDYLVAGRAYINVGDCSSAIPLLREGFERALAADFPDTDLIARLEQNLADCQAGSVFLPTPTPEAAPSADT